MIVISRAVWLPVAAVRSTAFFSLASNKLIIDERLSHMSVVPFSLGDSDLKVRTAVKVHFTSPQQQKWLILIPSFCLLSVLRPLCGPETRAINFKFICFERHSFSLQSDGNDFKGEKNIKFFQRSQENKLRLNPQTRTNPLGFERPLCGSFEATKGGVPLTCRKSCKYFFFPFNQRGLNLKASLSAGLRLEDIPLCFHSCREHVSGHRSPDVTRGLQHLFEVAA